MNLVLNTPLDIPDLIAFWDFQDLEFTDRSESRIKLTSCGETPQLANEGVFGPFSLPFSAQGDLPTHYLLAERNRVPQLNVGGKDAQVTVAAWIKRQATDYEGCQFIAGVWNEHRQRQYGLFLNLGIRNSDEQITGHLSSHGGATPGFPYCMDGAVGRSRLGYEQWHLASFSYDGHAVRTFLDGYLDTNPPLSPDFPYGSNPFRYPGGIHSGSADFTIGATPRPEKVLPDETGGYRDEGTCVANPFVGLLGGLAIFKRALTEQEMEMLASCLPDLPADAETSECFAKL